MLTRNSGTSSAEITKLDYSGNIINNYNIAYDTTYFAPTPDFKMCLTLNSLSTSRIIQIDPPPIVQVHMEIPVVTPGIPDVTKKISFSQDSNFAIIETNGINPVIIKHLPNIGGPLESSIGIADNIASAHFLDASNTLLIVFGQAQTHIVNLTSNVIYSFSPIVAT